MAVAAVNISIALMPSSDMSWRKFVFPLDLFLSRDSLCRLEKSIANDRRVLQVLAYNQEVHVQSSDPNSWVCNELLESLVREQIVDEARLTMMSHGDFDAESTAA